MVSCAVAKHQTCFRCQLCPCTRVLVLESTDHAGPHCTCTLCVSAARQLTIVSPYGTSVAAPPALLVSSDVVLIVLCVPFSCDRRWWDISAASIAAGVVTSATPCNSANSSRVTWVHASRMQPLSTPRTSKLRSYRRTIRPSSDPSGSRKTSFFVWMAIPCTAVAAAQCLASSALFALQIIRGLLRHAAFVAGFSARTSCQRFMSQPQHSRCSQERCLGGHVLHLHVA